MKVNNINLGFSASAALFTPKKDGSLKILSQYSTVASEHPGSEVCFTFLKGSKNADPEVTPFAVYAKGINDDADKDFVDLINKNKSERATVYIETKTGATRVVGSAKNFYNRHLKTN